VTYIERLAAEIEARAPRDRVPEGDTRALFLIYAALGLIKGDAVTRRDVHNAWAAWMASANPSHESIRPFDELDSETRAKDDPFVAAIRSALSATTE
jgi:hypothetical protein